jgi:hypothetical protein
VWWKFSKIDGSNGYTTLYTLKITESHTLNEWIVWYVKYYLDKATINKKIYFDT